MGFLPEAMRNYLLRLGWGHGDEEIIPTDKAIEWFDLDAVGRSPSRFDMAKLENLNAHYLREAEDDRLAALILPMLEERLDQPVDTEGKALLSAGMAGLKPRAKTLVELAGTALFYVRPLPLPFTEKAAALLTPEARQTLDKLATALEAQTDWTEAALEERVRRFAEAETLKLGAVAQPLRAALTGSTMSPGIFDVLAVLGKNRSIARIRAAVAGN
jgi:glutamyl-tRNA synthetase